MTIQEIKKTLSPHEFAERYPFLHVRKWDPVKQEYFKDYWTSEDDAVKCGYKKLNEPVMAFYQNDFYGWNSLILCWAEKVREVFLNNSDGKIPEDVWVTDIKEKYGQLRISFGGRFDAPYEKINEYTYMAEHLSYFVCYYCGHIGRSSNEKKLIAYRNAGGWIGYQCRKCAKRNSWQDIREYGISEDYFKKWLHSNPHFNMYKDIFNQEYERDEGDWFARVTTYEGDTETEHKYDCRELIEGLL